MEELSDKYGVKMACDLLGLSRSSYYYISQISDDTALREAIERICLRYSRYGYRRVTSMLQREKSNAGRQKVRLLMHDMGLQVHKKRRRVKTTMSRGEIPYPNLMKGMEIQCPDHVWCGDITYIGLINNSTIYLALLMDIYTRIIRGWSLRCDLSESLTQEALSKAVTTGHTPEIHHSDQGSQYKANRYCERLRSLGAKISMSNKGKAWENPFAESAIGHLKDEEVFVKEYVDFEDAYSNLSYFLDVFYNHKRIHSSLGYLTPAEFEAQYERE